MSEFPCLQLIEVDTVGKRGCIPSGSLEAGRLCFVHEDGDFLAQGVIDL